MPRYEALDSWRGICACMVVLLHFPTAGLISSLPVVQNGYLFVDFFFVLSGFVIQANYANRVGTPTEAGQFMIKRFGRLYPLHLFMLLCFIAIQFIQMLPPLTTLGLSEPFSGESKSGFAVLTNLGLVHSLGMHDTETWNSVSWSISTEFWAYVAFAVAVYFLKSNAIIAAAAACIICPVLIALLSDRYMNTTFDYGYIRCLFGFSMGMIAYDVFKKHVQHRTPSRFIATLLELAMVIATVVYVSTVGETVASLLAPVVFMLGVLVFALGRGAVSEFMNAPAALLIGKLSYSIYMVHIFIQTFWMIGGVVLGKILAYPLIQMVPRVGRDGMTRSFGQAPWQGDLATVAMLLSVIFVSYFTYKWIEDPFRNWFNAKARAFDANAVAAGIRRTISRPT